MSSFGLPSAIRFLRFSRASPSRDSRLRLVDPDDQDFLKSSNPAAGFELDRERRPSRLPTLLSETQTMPSVFCLVNDKHVPLYRVMWIADLPHFCGHEDCAHEGEYEIRLEQDESVWATRVERDKMLAAIEAWQGGVDSDEDWR